MDAFDQLQIERERTFFTFYGWRRPDGEPGGPYFKLAHSLSEALADLEENSAIDPDEAYVVTDAFLELGEEGPTVHVELRSTEAVFHEE